MSSAIQNTPRFPGPTDRTFIVGRTGSGKTQCATWHLSHADFHAKPYVIIDYKLDKLIGNIDRAKLIDVGDIPKDPGIYIVHPGPNDDLLVEAYLMSIWETENIGVYIDEGYMLDQRSSGLRAIATQGRSKNIPLIVLSQQPVWISRFAISEADFHQVFSLSDTEHHKIIRRFVPVKSQELDDLKPYHSYLYDVKGKRLTPMSPVESEDVILDRFDRRLKKIKDSKRFFI